MKDKKIISLDDVYKSLKKHDEEILKHFNDKNICDLDYLFYALNSDIVSNTLSIIMNIKIDNVKSIGVDNCCRTIMEAFTVLKMIAVGDISEDQAKIFRYHYSVVDLSNTRKYINDKEKVLDSYKNIIRDRAEAVKAMEKHFNCKISHVKKDNDFDDPNFYLKKNLFEKINFAHLIENYKIFGEYGSNIYNFFSIFVHPRYEKEFDYIDKIYEIRNEFIHYVLDNVYEYMVETKLFIDDQNINTFDQDFYLNPNLKNNVQSLKNIQFVFDSIISKTCFLDDGIDGFSMYFYYRIKEILSDMYISMTFGYKEHIISIFKSTIEYVAVFSYINECKTVDEFKKIKLAYCYSSRIQLLEILKSMNIDIVIDGKTLNGLKDLYDEYYKNKYKVNSFEKFVENISYDSTYFLFEERTSFNRMVNIFLNDLYENEEEREFVKLIYRISKDMNHGGGYAFNSSPGLIDVESNESIIVVLQYLLKELNAKMYVFSEHNIPLNLSTEIGFINSVINIHNEELGKIYKNYKN